MSETSVLIVGEGGRESELARAVSASVDRVYGASGTLTIEDLDNGVNLPINSTDIDALVDFASANNVTLTIVGSENQLLTGAIDRLRERGLVAFGPTLEQTHLETNKWLGYLKAREWGLAAPSTHQAFGYDRAAYLLETDATSKVLKAVGPASGKGVVLPESHEEGLKMARMMLNGEIMDGAAANHMLISERYHGPEVSIIMITDGHRHMILPLTQDHKRLKDGDRGPNTGGMGAFGPIPSSMITEHQLDCIDEAAAKTIAGLRRDSPDTPYRGAIYLGGMFADELDGSLAFIEYNVRFGDPETQVQFPLLELAGINAFDLLFSAAKGNLWIPPNYNYRNVGWGVVSVALAAENYADPNREVVLGEQVHGLPNQFQPPYDNVLIHHAGTRRFDPSVVETSGGRALYVTGLGRDVDEAAAYAYAAIGPQGVEFINMQYRKDIGHQARSN